MRLFSRLHLTQAVLSLLLSTSATHALSLYRRATVCNGHAELCDRSYGAVTMVGAHDSYAIGVNNLAVNQDQSVTTQLNDGIRMLQMQAHSQNGEIRLCHTLCSLFDGGTLQDYLKNVKSWLDTNPNEVLTLLIVNIDNLPASQYDSIFKTVGLDSVSYAPPSSPISASAWPTLGSMIDSGKRLVTFLDNGADPNIAPYLIDEFTNMWETAFDVTDPSLFDCTVNRTKGDASTQMYLINHFLDKLVFNQPVPDVAKANITNSASGPGSIQAHVDACVAANTRPPNFLLVDFYEFGGGSVFQVAASANNVNYNPSTVAQPLPTTSGTSPSESSGSTSSQGNGALSIAFRHHATTAIMLSLSIAIGFSTVF